MRHMVLNFSGRCMPGVNVVNETGRQLSHLQQLLLKESPSEHEICRAERLVRTVVQKSLYHSEKDIDRVEFTCSDAFDSVMEKVVANEYRIPCFCMGRGECRKEDHFIQLHP